MPSDPAAEGPALIPRMTQLTSCRKIPRKEAVFRIRRMVPLALLPARAQALRLATLPTSEALGLKPAAYMMTWLRRGHLPLQHHTRVPRDPTVLIDGVDRGLAPPRLSLSSPGRLNNLCLLKHRRCSTRVSCCLLRNMFLRWLMWTCQPRTLSRKPWLFCRLTAPLLWLTASLRLCRSTLSLCLRMPCAWHCLSGVTLNTSCLTARGSTVPSSVHLVQRLPIAPLSLPLPGFQETLLLRFMCMSVLCRYRTPTPLQLTLATVSSLCQRHILPLLSPFWMTCCKIASPGIEVCHFLGAILAY